MAEKKALKRFLIVYVFSTLFLIGLGQWLYYKSQVHFIIDSQVSKLSSKLKLFLNENKGMLRKLRFNETVKIDKNIEIAVYKNLNYMFGDFKIDNNFNNEFWNDDKYVYYIYTIPKRWGRVDIVAREKIDYEKIAALKKELLFFNVFVVFFVVFISFLLGKIFLQPLKNVINSLEDFIRDSTHEMNTPISVILTNIEMLKLKNIDLNELKRIEFSAKRLEKIFKDLTFIRLHHKRKKEMEKISVKDLVCKRLEIFETLVEQKKIKLKLNCSDFDILCDKEDLIRLIDNVLSNAIKYAPVNSEVYITVGKGELTVKNRGVIKNIKQITSKFYRENKDDGGFGLGLYIVKKICLHYGFKLNIENSNGFVKTTITF